MSGFMWLVLLLALGALTMAGAAGVDLPAGPSKPRITGPRGGAYWLSYRGRSYGPFSSWSNAERSALQLLAKEGRR